MLGAGHPTLVPFWSRSFPMPTRLTSHSVLNTAGQVAWRSDGPTKGKCLWEMHGVWGWDANKKEGVVLRENYFVKNPITGEKVTICSLFPPHLQLSISLGVDRLVYGLLLSFPARMGGEGATCDNIG
jgi:hypothetical protein